MSKDFNVLKLNEQSKTKNKLMIIISTKISREHQKYDNGTDLGMKPGNGLDSPHIALAEVEKNVNKAISMTNLKERITLFN